MPAFAIRTSTTKEARAWMKEVTERLEGNDLIRMYFRGRIKSLGDGLYVLSLHLIIPRFIPNAIAFLMAAVATIVYHAGLPKVGAAGYAMALLIAVVWNACWSAWFYRLLMRLGARKATGQWVRVSDATTDVLERVAHGTV